MMKVLGINDVYVTTTPVVYSCYGLGSCVGIFLIDRQLKISGGAHVPLPYAVPNGVFSPASALIRKLLESFHVLGSDLLCLRAKITGGAQMFENSQDIGMQNSVVVTQQLITNRIFIAASDLGGNLSRTAKFDSITGELLITTSEQKSYRI